MTQTKGCATRVGEPIATRWSASLKREIKASRVTTTTNLAVSSGAECSSMDTCLLLSQHASAGCCITLASGIHCLCVGSALCASACAQHLLSCSGQTACLAATLMRLVHVRPSFITDSAVVHICPVNGLALQTGHASVPADMYCCHVSLYVESRPLQPMADDVNALRKLCCMALIHIGCASLQKLKTCSLCKGSSVASLNS